MKKQEKIYINIKFMQALHSNNLKHICKESKQNLRGLKDGNWLKARLRKGYYSWSELEIEPKIFGLPVQCTGHFLALFFLK